jgi:preprotein translocase subunit SecA
MHGRRWSEGLHQAVEAKEGVQVKGETQTLATITIQNYFRLYEKLSGMTGTAETEETEFHEIYKLGVSVIPTNRPVIRDDRQDLVYKTRREKYNAILEETQRLHELGFPVLVGTVSVEVSETLARMFKRAGIPHNVLNAKYHQREAEIVAGAGQPGAVTIATNMAGRGTDIKLGPGVTESKPSQRRDAENQIVDVVEWGGLHIIGSERHESRRIDRQLRGRAGRQGDPGASQFFLSLEDDLMRLFGSDRIAKLMDRMGAEEGEMLTHSLITRSIEQAQKRVELQNFQSRKRLLEYDDVMNQQREVIYSLRSFALEGGEELKAEAQKMVEKGVTKRVENMLGEFDSQEEWDFSLVRQDLLMHYMLVVPGFEDGSLPGSEAEARQRAVDAGTKAFEDKLQSLGEYGSQLLAIVMLHVLDEKWKDHLYDLDQLRNAIGYRSWGQKDPLIEYKHEAYNMFVDLMDDIHNTFTERFLRAQITFEERAAPPPPMYLSGPDLDGNGEERAPRPRKKQFNALGVMEEIDVDGGEGTDATLDIAPAEAPKKGTAVRPEPTVHVGGKSSSLSKAMAGGAIGGVPGVPGVPGGSADWSNVGRNDPCPCGSGKKFKKCHGANL